MGSCFFIVARLLVGAVLSVYLVIACGPSIADAFLPVLQWAFVHLDTEDRVFALTIGEQGVVSGNDRVYRLVVAPEKAVYVGERIKFPQAGGWAAVSVLVAYLWQPLVIALPLALAWPATRFSEWPVRLGLLASLLAGLALIDLPFTLWAQIWKIYIDALAPGTLSPLLVWSSFLQSGGRLLLGLVMASTSVYLGHRVAGMPSNRQVRGKPFS